MVGHISFTDRAFLFYALRKTDGTCGAHQSAEVTAHTLGAHKTWTTGVVVEDKTIVGKENATSFNLFSFANIHVFSVLQNTIINKVKKSGISLFCP